MPVLPGSDNLFPKLLMVEGLAPATPATGVTVVYCKSSDGLLYAKDDAGVERLLESGAALTSHLGDTIDAHDASAISVVDAGTYFPPSPTVESALQHIGAHPTDATDAHDASAISIADAGTYFTATDVEGALQELGAGGGGGGSVATDAIWDAAGDLAVGTGANTAAKLTKGSNGDVLSVVAGAVAWAAPSGGGDYVKLAETIVAGSAAADVTFTGISSAYSILVIEIVARSSTTGSEVGSIELRVGNGSIDTGSNYGYHRAFTGSGSSASSSTSATAASVGMVSRDSSPANRFSATTVKIHDYARTDKHKTIQASSVHPGFSEHYENRMVGVWKSTSAIDQVRVYADSGNLMIGTTVRLYGIS